MKEKCDRCANRRDVKGRICDKALEINALAFDMGLEIIITDCEDFERSNSKTR